MIRSHQKAILFILAIIFNHFIHESHGCSLVLMERGSTTFARPLLTSLPGYVFVQAHSYGFTDYTSLIVNVADGTYHIASSDETANAHAPNSADNFLLTPTTANSKMNVTLLDTWTDHLTTMGTYHVVVKGANSHVYVDTLLNLQAYLGDSSINILHFVSNSLQATFLVTISNIYVVPFSDPTSSSNFSSFVDLDFQTSPILYDSEQIVYFNYPCCLCNPGGYYVITTNSLTRIPVRMDQSVFDERTNQWTNVDEYGRVVVYDLLSHQSTSFQITFTSSYWINLAIAIPTVVAVLALIGIVLFLSRSRVSNLFKHMKMKEENESPPVEMSV